MRHRLACPREGPPTIWPDPGRNRRPLSRTSGRGADLAALVDNVRKPAVPLPRSRLQICQIGLQQGQRCGRVLVPAWVRQFVVAEGQVSPPLRDHTEAGIHRGRQIVETGGADDKIRRLAVPVRERSQGTCAATGREVAEIRHQLHRTDDALRGGDRFGAGTQDVESLLGDQRDCIESR